MANRIKLVHEASAASSAADAPVVPKIRLDDFIPYRISVLANSYNLGTARILRTRLGMALREWRVLGQLNEWGPMSVVELSEKTAMDKARVSRAVTSLVEAGYVRRASPSGPRRAPLQLTASGQKVLAELVPIIQRRAATLVSPLTEQERSMLLSMLNKLQSQVWVMNMGMAFTEDEGE